MTQEVYILGGIFLVLLLVFLWVVKWLKGRLYRAEQMDKEIQERIDIAMDGNMPADEKERLMEYYCQYNPDSSHCVGNEKAEGIKGKRSFLKWGLIVVGAVLIIGALLSVLIPLGVALAKTGGVATSIAIGPMVKAGVLAGVGTAIVVFAKVLVEDIYNWFLRSAHRNEVIDELNSSATITGEGDGPPPPPSDLDGDTIP